MSAAVSKPSPTSTTVVTSHASCHPKTSCGYYEDLSYHLPSYARSVVLGYLEPDERARCFPLCNAVFARMLPLHPETFTGWKASQCTEGAIRDLVVEKMMSVAADGAQRSAACKTNVAVLDRGFWYPNDYFEFLQDMNQAQRLEHLKEKNAFFNGVLPRGFASVPDPRSACGKRPCGYQLKIGVLPTDGLPAVRQTLCFLDCNEGIELAFYEALREILGDRRFNVRFRADGPSPLRLDNNLYETPLVKLSLVSNVPGDLGEQGARPVQPGDAVYFKNVPFYKVKHHEGEWAGFHVVCMQKSGIQRFVGNGTPPEGCTEDQILALFANAFNKRPILASSMYSRNLAVRIEKSGKVEAPPGMSQSQFLRMAQEFIMTKEVIAEAAAESPDLAGFHASSVWKPNAEAIRKHTER